MDVPGTEPWDEAAPHLAVDVAYDGWRVVAQVSGAADSTTSGRLRDAIAPYLGVSRRVVVDLSGVTAMDGSCLVVLAQVGSILAEDGGSLVLQNPSRAARRVLAVSGLEKVFHTEIG